jgi:flavin-dependent dehydrogenase
VLVVGGGPSGAACAYWLAEAGHDVLLVERKRYPREKTCGDGLTPRSVRQLHDIGLAEELTRYHRFVGLRSHAFGRTLDLAWPEHPDLPGYGYVITRKDLDQLVAQRAEKAGATVWQSADATEPLVTGGLVRGAVVARTGLPPKCEPATSSSPMGPTPDSAARSVPAATAAIRSVWPSGGTTSRLAMTSPG